MKILSVISAVLFLSAIAMIAISVIAGESEFGLFIIFPFVIGSGPIAAAGAILLFFAVLLAFISFATRLPKSDEFQAPQTQNTVSGFEKRYGGVVMIGPVPIAFGSDSKIARLMMLIGIIIFVAIVAVLILSVFL
ncbi:MAG: DUF131 domain-containing protein [Thermoplasmata archaeon]